MSAVEKWYEVMKSNDMDKLDELLAEDVVFYSPVVYTPQKGKDITKMYLTAAGGVFGEGTKDAMSDSNESKSNFKYIKEIIGEKSALLEFETEMDGVYVNGVDVISWNEEGKITEFKVIVRPLQAVNMLHQKMQAMLESMK
ncbi:MAG: nuclear transport factor 2 family protein [SAR86 cluster bacterium]|nr:nuclear transport factor 2 family protein [SAR86 cluster bacterium]